MMKNTSKDGIVTSPVSKTTVVIVTTVVKEKSKIAQLNTAAQNLG